MIANRSLLNAIAAGGLTAGALDIAYALAWFGPKGVSLGTIFQSIAAGLVGRGAYAGGVSTAGLGAILHVALACAMAAVFTLAATLLPQLVRRPYLFGPTFGLICWAVMYLIVLPHDAAPPKRLPAGPDLWTSLLAHAFLVGLPMALFARRALVGTFK